LPHFTRQISPQGPIVDAFVVVSLGRASALTSANQTIPQPIRVRALIDTGASHTCVDPSVLTALGLTPTGTTTVVTPTTGLSSVTVNQYDVGLVIPSAQASHSSFIRPTVAVSEHELVRRHGFHVLMGRDILADCLFIYDGQSGLFTLVF